MSIRKMQNVSFIWKKNTHKKNSKDNKGVNLPAPWFCLIAPSSGQHCHAHHKGLLPGG